MPSFGSSFGDRDFERRLHEILRERDAQREEERRIAVSRHAERTAQQRETSNRASQVDLNARMAAMRDILRHAPSMMLNPGAVDTIGTYLRNTNVPTEQVGAAVPHYFEVSAGGSTATAATYWRTFRGQDTELFTNQPVFPVPDLKNYHKFLRTMAAIEAKAAEGFAWKRRLVWAEAKARKQLGLGW